MLKAPVCALLPSCPVLFPHWETYTTRVYEWQYSLCDNHHFISLLQECVCVRRMASRGRAVKHLPLRVKSQLSSFTAQRYYSFFSSHTRSMAHTHMHWHVPHNEEQGGQLKCSGYLKNMKTGLTLSVLMLHLPLFISNYVNFLQKETMSRTSFIWYLWIDASSQHFKPSWPSGAKENKHVYAFTIQRE